MRTYQAWGLPRELSSSSRPPALPRPPKPRPAGALERRPQPWWRLQGAVVAAGAARRHRPPAGAGAALRHSLVAGAGEAGTGRPWAEGRQALHQGFQRGEATREADQQGRPRRCALPQGYLSLKELHLFLGGGLDICACASSRARHILDEKECPCLEEAMVPHTTSPLPGAPP